MVEYSFKYSPSSLETHGNCAFTTFIKFSRSAVNHFPEREKQCKANTAKPVLNPLEQLLTEIQPQPELTIWLFTELPQSVSAAPLKLYRCYSDTASRSQLRSVGTTLQFYWLQIQLLSPTAYSCIKLVKNHRFPTGTWFIVVEVPHWHNKEHEWCTK